MTSPHNFIVTAFPPPPVSAMANVPLRVLGDRVLVKPDTVTNAPETLPSGVIIAKSLPAAIVGEDPVDSVSRGTVVGVGTPRHPLQHEAQSLAVVLESRSRARSHGLSTPEVDAAGLLRDLVRRRPSVAIGDDVLFSRDAGQEIVLDGVTYIILREQELLAVVEPEA